MGPKVSQAGSLNTLWGPTAVCWLHPQTCRDRQPQWDWPSGCAPARGKAGVWTKWRLQDRCSREEGSLVCAGPGGTVTSQFSSCPGHCFPLEGTSPHFGRLLVVPGPPGAGVEATWCDGRC